MIRGEPLTAIIPARSGSKGIPGKNLYEIDGENLVERTIRLAKNNSNVDNIIVTTDDPEIYKIAQNNDAAPPNLRPKHLSTDTALTIDAVKHVLKDSNIQAGYVLLLQVTTPLRTDDDLHNLLKKFEDHPEADAIVSVVNHNSPHPEKLLRQSGDFIIPYLGKNPGVPRQTLQSLYALNGAFYLTSFQIIHDESTLLPEKTIPFVMPQERSVNLDEPIDIIVLEAILEKRIRDG